MTEQNKQWICRKCEFREDNHCLCPAMYKNSGELKPPIVYINCSQSFTECKYFSEGTEQDKELLKSIIEGRLSSIESLAWNQQYDWSQKDDIIEKHLNYILKDIESKYTPIIEKQERERIEKQFIWGQVKVIDLEKGEVEWTMRCISDEDWQALKSSLKEAQNKWA